MSRWTVGLLVFFEAISPSIPSWLAAGEAAENAVRAGVPRIAVRPCRVYAGAAVLARLEFPGAEGSERAGDDRIEGDAGRGAPPLKRYGNNVTDRGVKVSWKATGGLLLTDDLLEVEWRAPSRAGVCRLSVTVSPEGTGPSALPGLTVDVDVEVHAPSTTGMAWIPPGEFRRGDFLGTRNTVEVKTIQNASDEPFHAVHLDGYWIDKHLVTNREFRDFLVQCLEQGMARVEEIAVMGQFDGAWVPYYYFQSFEKLIPNYHDTRNARKPAFLHVIQHVDRELRIKQGMENHPVVDVSWFGAAAYARFHGKKLPSEAQWEKGARGTDGRRFPWGNNMASAYHANLNRELGTELTPVGSFSPTGDSPFGVADMLSDCFEWTADWFNPNYYEDYRSDMPLRNPRGPFWGRSHTIRGFPASLSFPQVEAETSEPVSIRYNWRFEFLIGDAFANSSTSFRTVLETGE